MALAGIQGNKRVGAPASSFLPTYSGTQVAPTYAGSTDYGGLGGASGTPGINKEWTDEFGTRWRYQNNGDGTGEWLQVLSNGSLSRPQDVAEGEARLAGTSVAGNGSGIVPSSATRPSPTTPRAQLPAKGLVNDYANLAGDPTIANRAASDRDAFGAFLGNGISAADQDRRTQLDNQRGIDQNAINALTGNLGNIQNNANTATQRTNDAYNSFITETNPLMDRFTARGYGDPVQADPQGLAMQTQAYNWAGGVANGSLDYQAAMASVQYATAQLAQLSQYSSDPADTQRQLEALGKIQDDIESGGIGQREAIDMIKQELSTGEGRQRAAIDKILEDIDHGGDDQREIIAKYKALSDPQVTAQERYLAELARRSFESQDKSNRDAVMQDLSLRGMRSGGAEISNALAGQERLGQDRTLAELGLQANAVQRAQVAMQGWQTGVNNLRAQQQQAIAMYNQAEASLRGAQQQGIGMLASEQNALRQDQQRAIAMFTDAANQIRAQNDAVGMFNTDQANTNSMFNAQQQNNVSMFNADAYNQNSMFNAQQTNNASANNQQTRVAGGVQMGNMANSIRSMNDAINMFNKEQSQISQRFQDQSYQNESVRLGNQAQSRNQAAADATSAIYGPNGWQTAATNAAGQNARDIFGIQTGTNAFAGSLGQQNLGNTIAAGGALFPWAQSASNAAGAQQQGALTGLATKALVARGGVPANRSTKMV